MLLKKGAKLWSQSARVRDIEISYFHAPEMSETNLQNAIKSGFRNTSKTILIVCAGIAQSKKDMIKKNCKKRELQWNH
jgi:hypothetical protein